MHAADTGQDREGLEAELAQACMLHGRWAELKGRAATLEAGLLGAKAQHLPALDAQAWSSDQQLYGQWHKCWSHVQRSGADVQVVEVAASSAALLSRLQQTAAPSGAPGVAALEALKQEAGALVTTADDLGKMQRLFGLPVTLYPALTQVSAHPPLHLWLDLQHQMDKNTCQQSSVPEMRCAHGLEPDKQGACMQVRRQLPLVTAK